MLNRLGVFAARYHRAVLIASALLFVVVTILGIGAFKRLQSGGFVSASASSSQAEALVASHFGGEQGLVVLISARAGSVSSPAVVAVGKKVTATLESNSDISNVTSYWTTPAASLRSGNGKAALILAHVKGSDDQVDSRTMALLAKLTAYGGAAATVQGGGSSATGSEITTQVKKDLLLVSVVAVPITTLLLYFAFASLLAALLPLVVAMLAIMGTFAELRVLAAFTSVSTYAVDLTIALSLGLAMDYSLLLINRYREEVGRGRGSRAAIARAVETAGRTIVFSGLTVALALTALLVFPLYFLRSFAYAGNSGRGFCGARRPVRHAGAPRRLFEPFCPQSREGCQIDGQQGREPILETSSLGGHQPARAQRVPRVGRIAHHRLTVPARSFL